MLALKDVAQIPVAVNDAHNLDFIDRAIVAVRVSFVEKQVDALDQHSCGGGDLRTPHS
jgi:hypothetical protein